MLLKPYHDDTLLSKLDHDGITDIANSLLESYLIGKHQYIYFNDTESDRKHLTIGVPQGSVLGPLLFTLY